MSGKTIEIEKGDTFTITPACSLCKYGGGQGFFLSAKGFVKTGNEIGPNERDITAAQFRTIAEIAGYTVVEKQPEPEAVVVTHGVQYPECDGLFSYVGTKAACDKFALECGGYVVVPIRFGGASNG